MIFLNKKKRWSLSMIHMCTNLKVFMHEMKNFLCNSDFVCIIPKLSSELKFVATATTGGCGGFFLSAECFQKTTQNFVFVFPEKH